MKTSIHRLALGLLAAGAFAASTQQAQAAAYATGGSGQYRSEILWLTWGGGENGTPEVALTNGASSSATIPVTGNEDLMLTCSLSAINGAIESYQPGDWTGDALDDMYHIGGTGSANQLIAGIMGRTGTHSFTVDCEATLGGQPHRIPGLVVADAESMNTGTEYLEGTADGTWNVVEVHTGNGNNYGGRKTDVAGGQQIRFGQPGGEGTGTSPAAVALLTFNDSAYGAGERVSMDFSIEGGGNTAIAIGLLAPAADFGDAPASYGGAMHLLPGLVAVPDGLPANGVTTNINAPGFPLGALLPPDSGFLGSSGPDSEPGSQHSADARGDDNSGSAGPNEEDAWPSGDVLAITELAQQIQRTISCNGSGTVAGWIDFNRNGTFDAGERAQGACSGGSAALSWTVPADVSPGTSFVRLRYASDAADVQLPTGVAQDGEVEDHLLDITLEADLSLVKDVDPASGVVGEEVTYTLTVGNAGAFAGDGAVITDPPVDGLDCPAANTVSCAANGDAQCPAAPITVGNLQGAGLTVPLLPQGGGVVLQFACTLLEPVP